MPVVEAGKILYSAILMLTYTKWYRIVKRFHLPFQTVDISFRRRSFVQVFLTVVVYYAPRVTGDGLRKAIAQDVEWNP